MRAFPLEKEEVMTRQAIWMTLGLIAVGAAMLVFLIGADPFSDAPPPAQETKLRIEAR